MNHRIALIAGCLLSLAAFGAQAQATGVQLRTDTGFYIGAGLGRSEARDFCSIGGACDSKDITGNIFAGYQFNRHFAIEGGYSNFGEATSSGFVGGVATTVVTETTGFELVGVGSLPLSENFSLYVKLGMFRYDSDGTATGGLSATAGDDGFEPTFGFGAEYSFTRNLAARLEWQRYYEVGSGLLNTPKADITVLRLAARYKF